MSAAHDAHADPSAGHHDAHDHFDNEPSTELGADEPRTPTWVPVLGLALFFLAGVAWMMMGSDDADKPTADNAAAAVATPANVAPTPPPNPVARPTPMPAQNVVQAPQPAGSNGLRQLTPEQARELQKQIESVQALHKGNKPAQPVPVPPQPVQQ